MPLARHATLSTLITIVITTGCIQQSQAPSVPTALEAQAVFDSIIFDPSATCEQLARRFSLTDLVVVDTPDLAGIAYEEHHVPTPDGQLLRTWYMPAAQDRGLVVVTMGAAGSMACYMYTAVVLVTEGWSVVMYDFRGMGGSSGALSGTAMGDDLLTIVDWSLGYTGRSQLTLMGISLGTIPVVEVATKRPGLINAVILDSPVALGDEIARFGRILPGLTWIADYLGDELFPERLIGGMAQPSLFFLHGADRLTPPWSVEALFDAAGGDKTLVVYPSYGHARGVFLETESYTANLEAFLSRAWPVPPFSEIAIGTETPFTE